ncbi:hypothetical protein B0H11DRAFT_1733200 [Mycena galericulata]|nr:hypothetical protein B0H11DRAFT_1733200 [Mycena galericulata]
MDLSHLLNEEPPEPLLVDVSTQILALTALLHPTEPILATRDVQRILDDALSHILAPPASPEPPSPNSTPNLVQAQSQDLTDPVRYGIKINRQTILSELHTYSEGTSVEYPQTSDAGVGHLFLMDSSEPETWRGPMADFAYSLGSPKGFTRVGEESFVEILTGADGVMVPCRIQFLTCQGSKICPKVNRDKMTEPHTHATRALLQQRLLNDREARLAGTSPTRDVFQKTSALVSALRKMGCSVPLCEDTIYDSDEEEARDAMILHRKRNRRGYTPIEATCEGRLKLSYDHRRQPYINNNKNHYFNSTISDGSYDLSYLEALFTGDEDEILEIEEAATALGFGPLLDCTTVCNHSSQKTLCPFDHRDEEGKLMQLEMQLLPCTCRFKAYVPLVRYRKECSKILVVVKGVHHHPIPLPAKTPPAIKEEILQLLPRFQEDLPDLTPRRFLRNPIVKSYLAVKFPHLLNPTLSDVHISLANRSHLKAYIDQVRKALFPHGTDWKGIWHLEIKQRIERPLKDRYIRCVVDLDATLFASHPEDEAILVPVKESRLRFIVCMGWEGSERLRNCQYVQSDIGFKRVVGFYEFELAGWERDAHTSVVFCRIFLNRQTAIAHQKIIQAMEDIVFEDTGNHLQWRHIHGSQMNDYDGKILQWAGDQHSGQAKVGLGLHLQQLSQAFPEKMDLHEPWRTLASLSPYDHLNRQFRLCVAHGFRNIRKCKVPEPVKDLMRSLVCIEHPDWDGTIEQIKTLGGKAGRDWVQDKERTHFAFQGMCWAKSFIPKLVWQAGEQTSNLIESVHADVNREGVHCTLLGV